MNPFSSPLVSRLVDLALEEDLAFGDITSDLLEPGLKKRAQIIARQDLVVCGLPLTEIIISRAKSSIKIKTKSKEGSKVKCDAVMQELYGPASEITSLERTIINFLQRLCGVSTHTRSIVEQAKGITVLDTRKTMPGFRLLDKYATSIGGAKNHRMHLGAMILVKNNHIDAAPGKDLREKVRNLLGKVAESSGYYVPVQVEVRSEAELKEVLKFFPQAVLLDNMEDALITRCLKGIKANSPRTLCEVSGGIDSARLKKLAALGVSAASIGSLTTRAPNVDISMRIIS